MQYKKFILDSFKLLEDGNHIEFLFQLDDEITLDLNHVHVCKGKTAVRDQLSKYYTAGLQYEHIFLNVWEVDNTYTITADLSIKKDKKEIDTVPWLTIVKVANAKITNLEFFVDFFNTKEVVLEGSHRAHL